jgi:hypothetical protein
MLHWMCRWTSDTRWCWPIRSDIRCCVDWVAARAVDACCVLCGATRRAVLSTSLYYCPSVTSLNTNLVQNLHVSTQCLLIAICLIFFLSLCFVVVDVSISESDAESNVDDETSASASILPARRTTTTAFDVTFLCCRWCFVIKRWKKIGRLG